MDKQPAKQLKNQCQRCGAILEPKKLMEDPLAKGSGLSVCGFPIYTAPACPRCGWNAKPKESVN